MRKLIISAIVLLTVGAGLRAQNLDPTVVVTNTYAQQAGVVEKPSYGNAGFRAALQFGL